MTQPTFYHSTRLPEPMVALRRMGIVYFPSDPATVYFIHIKGMLEFLEETIVSRDGDFSIGRRFDAYWIVLRVHCPHQLSVVAFTVWGGDGWLDTLTKIQMIQRLARTRLRAHRARQIAKLKSFVQHTHPVLPSDLQLKIVSMCIDSAAQPRCLRAGSMDVRHVETSVFKERAVRLANRAAAGTPAAPPRAFGPALQMC